MKINELEQHIREFLPCEYLSVKGDGRHFFVSVVSPLFAGVSRLSRHRLIENGLKEFIDKDELHSLSITLAATPDEWKEHPNNSEKPEFRCYHSHQHHE